MLLAGKVANNSILSRAYNLKAHLTHFLYLGFPGGLDGKNLPKMQDPGLIPGWERVSGKGNCNPLHYSCLKNSMDRGAWWAILDEVSKSQT